MSEDGDNAGVVSGGVSGGEASAAIRAESPFERATVGLGTSLLAVVAALGLGAIIIGGSGKNPLTAYGSILAGSFGNWFAIGETLARAAPLALVGVGAAVALRAGVITIGAQGQLIAGSIGALATGLLLQDAPSAVAIPLAAIGGAVFGMVWVLIPALLRAAPERQRDPVHPAVQRVRLPAAGVPAERSPEGTAGHHAQVRAVPRQRLPR